MKAGKIRSFDEKIPSMNEVFITAVSSPQSAISSL
jgi:ABC-2 type transport system ATP-binding protein